MSIAEVIHSRATMEGFRGLIGCYELGEVVGRGGSGVIIRAIRREDRLEVAVKVVSKASLSPSSRRALAREVQVLKESQGSEHVVGFVEALEDSKFVYVVIEYLGGGDLYRRLKAKKAGLSEEETLEIASYILSALSFLHERGIAHRDLKLENIMFASEDISTLKVVDFGLSYWKQARGTHQGCGEFCGTLQYCAPEIAAQKHYVPEEVDIWGLGVVMYALISRKLPFFSDDRGELLHVIMHKEALFEDPVWDTVSKSTIQLIQLLLCKRGAGRPSSAVAQRLVQAILNEEDPEQALFAKIVLEEKLTEKAAPPPANIFEFMLDVLQMRGLQQHVASA